jgi:hypothetical protein
MAPGASGKVRWLSTLPIDQVRQATVTAIRPCVEAWKLAPCVSISTPTRPTAMPAPSMRPGFTP